MTAQLKTLLTNKLGMIIIILSVLWSLLDASTRLLPLHSSKNKINKTIEIKPLLLPKLSTQTLNKLSAVYLLYSESSIEDKKIMAMSTDEQNKQQGELVAIYINDNKLSLKAVIQRNIGGNTQKSFQKPQQSSALILVENISSGEHKIEKFDHLSIVYGYQLSIEKNTQVILTKQHNPGQQKIILTMYK